MKASFIIQFILLLLVSLIRINRADEESCAPGDTTYALCTVDGEVTTVVSKSFTGDVLLEECHEHFSEEILEQPICHEHTEEEEERKPPTTAQRFGYGFLATFIICILSFGGLLAFPWLYRVSFQYILATFTALAVGTLFGDAMFHLIPFALGLHSHESSESGHEHRRKRADAHEEEDHSSVSVPIYQWRMFVAVMVLYAFYLLEIFLHWLTDFFQRRSAVHSTNQSPEIADEAQTRHSHNHSHTHNHNELDPTLMCIGKNCPTHGNMSRSSSKNGKANSSGTKEALTDSPQAVNRATGWMIIIGDGIHNFADGLAIGAAFSANLMLGLTTTIAVGCHELPHEFGDYAILIQSGFTHRWALFWNFISATTAIIGFFVGAGVSTNEGARQWIFAVTIGMFLYIALVDLLPTLLLHEHFKFKRFICVNIGFLVGIAIMFILAIFEDNLLHVGQ